jgi:hypothetical protein
LEPIRDYRAGENFLHALPWRWIASGQGRQTCRLQLCITCDLPRLLCPLPALRHQGKIYEQGDAHLLRGDRLTWVRKDEDYVADFCLVSRRYLDDFEYKVFRFHFLLGADWKLCCRQMKIDRGTFFHAVYRIQQKLGRVFRDLEPYSLFPLDEYFGGSVRKAPPPMASDVIEMPRPPVAPAFLKTA